MRWIVAPALPLALPSDTTANLMAAIGCVSAGNIGYRLVAAYAFDGAVHCAIACVLIGGIAGGLRRISRAVVPTRIAPHWDD